MMELSGDTDYPYEVIGQISISEMGEHDPLSERSRDVVQPRACKMGGEALAVMMAVTNHDNGRAASATVYAVLRRKPQG